MTAPTATIADTPTGVPTARQLRAHLRKARSRHHDHSLGDVLGDAYVIVLFVGMYGWFAVSASRDLLGHQLRPAQRLHGGHRCRPGHDHA
ncbi:hypothetical protein ACWCO3_34770, partial [Micromonospora sp. NPDC002411]